MSISPDRVHETLSKYIIVDGFDFVLDPQKSHGCQIYDSRSGKYYLDGFSFFASAPLGAIILHYPVQSLLKKWAKLLLTILLTLTYIL